MIDAVIASFACWTPCLQSPEWACSRRRDCFRSAEHAEGRVGGDGRVDVARAAGCERIRNGVRVRITAAEERDLDLDDGWAQSHRYLGCEAECSDRNPWSVWCDLDSASGDS